MSRFIGVLLLGAAAYLTNLFPVQLSFGLHFLFGGLFAMLAAILFGPWAGAAAAAIGALPTIELWGHPFAVLSMTLEAWVVGFEARSGGLHHTQTDLLYWLLLGGPLVVVTYTFGAHIPLLAAFVAALKQAVNGLALTSVASVLALAAAWCRRHRPLPLEVFLSSLMTFLVLLPLVLSLNWTVRDSGAHLRDQVRGEAVRAGEVVQASLVRELADQRRLLGTLAQAAEARSLVDLPAGLKALWLLDGEGRVLSRLPAGMAVPAPDAARPSAAVVMTLPGPVGRAILLTEPVTLPQSGKSGWVAAALDAGWLSERILAGARPLEMEVAVLDASGQVLFSDWEETSPEEVTASLRAAEQVAFEHEAEAPELGWRIHVRKPLQAVEYALYRSYLRSHLIALALITLLIAAARLVAYMVTRPLVQLAAVVVTPEGELSNLPAEQPIWISEVRTVTAHLEEVGDRIRGLVQSLQESRRELEERNVELAVANRYLADEAFRDVETGLPNERALRLQMGLRVEENRPFTLILLEQKGAEPVKLAGHLHRGAAQHGGEAYRRGRERFALLFPTGELSAAEQTNWIFLLRAGEEGFSLRGLRLGIARFPADGQTVPAVLEAAERELHGG